MLPRIWLVLAAIGPTAVWAAPSADLWARWEAHDPASEATIDHRSWNALLSQLVVPGDDGINRVKYGSVTNEQRARLESYLAALQATSISEYSRPVQMAYWINLYNALTVRLILDHYPVDSIRDIDISPGFFSDGPWDAELASVEGEALTLNDIEHRILRPIWGDNRIHYAVNCASLGCPNLDRTAYTGETVDTMLDAAARAYVNHPRGAKVTGGELQVSSIYHWYEEDFGGSESGVINHLRAFAENQLVDELSTVDDIDGHDYDWSLNDAGGAGDG